MVPGPVGSRPAGSERAGSGSGRPRPPSRAWPFSRAVRPAGTATTSRTSRRPRPAAWSSWPRRRSASRTSRPTRRNCARPTARRTTGVMCWPPSPPTAGSASGSTRPTTTAARTSSAGSGWPSASRTWSQRCAAGSGGRWRPPRRTTRGVVAVGERGRALRSPRELTAQVGGGGVLQRGNQRHLRPPLMQLTTFFIRLSSKTLMKSP